MKLFGKIIRLKELQLFAEGAGAGTGEGGSDAGSQTGAQAAAADAQTAEPTFDELIKGKYKADYDARIQKTIQARMRGAKTNEERLAKTEPLLQMLGQKYSVDAGDVDALMAALDNDEQMWQAEAADKGMSVENLKALRTAERENAMLKRQQELNQREAAARETYTRWAAQAEQAKAKFPGLDLESCLEDAQFVSMLQSGVDVESAYWARYHDDIMQAGMEKATTEAQKKLSASVASGSRRPTESGVGNGPTVSQKVDVSNMSRSEFTAYMDRIMRGERISFG
jgi:hypothetical protein